MKDSNTKTLKYYFWGISCLFLAKIAIGFTDNTLYLLVGFFNMNAWVIPIIFLFFCVIIVYTLIHRSTCYINIKPYVFILILLSSMGLNYIFSSLFASNFLWERYVANLKIVNVSMNEIRNIFFLAVGVIAYVKYYHTKKSTLDDNIKKPNNMYFLGLLYFFLAKIIIDATGCILYPIIGSLNLNIMVIPAILLMLCIVLVYLLLFYRARFTKIHPLVIILVMITCFVIDQVFSHALSRDSFFTNHSYSDKGLAYSMIVGLKSLFMFSVGVIAYIKYYRADKAEKQIEDIE